MKQLPKAVTFDNFGTLIDWEGEIQKYMAKFLERNGIKEVDPKTVQHRWEEIQFDYIQGDYKPYRKVLHDTLAMTFKEFGYAFTEEDCVEFSDSMGTWQPFPDSRDALLELKKYCKIVLITNTDNDIIKESVKQLGVEFDDVITAEMAGAYKPSHKGFDLARQRLGLKKEEILHAGFGFKYDVVPATELGYETCWINRQGEIRPIDVKETYLVGDMRTFVYMIKGMAQTFAEQK
ncbi:MAG TPA: haloacid dehalogenase type II [Bacillota bacterium]|nr:haloacid dehalogenase type II [Bacillota bacterium]HNT04017.1 haloacid dehalogenase type II [Bacillota bacterium]HPX68551.1 haloacid dehalogenase type II [Bacillota bacterium]HQA66460.1 haloacid dehalogenase type II [Bacillota bacterium]HQO42161.1 haloacid dehalogenase type II [Bacillota bacterium]